MGVWFPVSSMLPKLINIGRQSSQDSPKGQYWTRDTRMHEFARHGTQALGSFCALEPRQKLVDAARCILLREIYAQVCKPIRLDSQKLV